MCINATLFMVSVQSTVSGPLWIFLVCGVVYHISQIYQIYNSNHDGILYADPPVTAAEELEVAEFLCR